MDRRRHERLLLRTLKSSTIVGFSGAGRRLLQYVQYCTSTNQSNFAEVVAENQTAVSAFRLLWNV
jgi:hypothetical protein